jgi:tRNA pseudouridine38-40 synthase
MPDSAAVGCMLTNFKLVIEYDGTAYCGWQRQPNGPSIQQTIENALQIMTRRKIGLIGSGRTDAGVHALGQVANFSCDTAITPAAFQKGLNGLLPPDIVIHECSPVAPAFHARYDARAKTYRYSIRNGPLPAAIGRQYEWWVRAPLDVDAMSRATRHLVGERDFKAFEGAGSPRSSTVRTVTLADVQKDAQGRISFEIAADGFLRHMVRNIAGTLLSVGNGALPPEDIPVIMASKDRARAAATAPAQGLCLIKVDY